jgi:hypothetical protein
MRIVTIGALLLATLAAAACTTPKTAAEAKATQCSLSRSECEARIRRCQRTATDLPCRDAEMYCNDVRARCGS